MLDSKTTPGHTAEDQKRDEKGEMESTEFQTTKTNPELEKAIQETSKRMFEQYHNLYKELENK